MQWSGGRAQIETCRQSDKLSSTERKEATRWACHLMTDTGGVRKGEGSMVWSRLNRLGMEREMVISWLMAWKLMQGALGLAPLISGSGWRHLFHRLPFMLGLWT